jgi:hypothetical protein
LLIREAEKITNRMRGEGLVVMGQIGRLLKAGDLTVTRKVGNHY